MKDQHKKVEQYFAGELSEQEQKALEDQLGQDSNLAEAFQLEKDLMEGIEAFGNDQLREQLGQIHQEEIEQTVSVARKKSKQKKKIEVLTANYPMALSK